MISIGKRFGDFVVSSRLKSCSKKISSREKLLHLKEQYLGTIPRIINSENTLLFPKLCNPFISLLNMPKIDFWSRFFFGNSGNFIRIINIFIFLGWFLMNIG